MKNILLAIAVIMALGSCTQTSNETQTAQKDSTQQTVSRAVYAMVETTPIRSVAGEDAADDPALWFNAENPENSLVLGTNKKEGLEVYNLNGVRLAYYPVGRVNNVDVAYNFDYGDNKIAIAAASNRTFGRIDVWAIDATGKEFLLISDTTQISQLADVYGFCLAVLQGKHYAFVNGKSGKVEQYLLTTKNGKVQMELVRKLDAGAQTEGMVVDTTTQKLYLGVEEKGIYVYNALPTGGSEYIPLPQSNAENNTDLAYDIEGLTLYHPNSQLKWLLASSQGNNRYLVYDVLTQPKYLGYFSIEEKNGIDGTSETDGIDVFSKTVGQNYPEGMLMVQDGFNTEISGDTIAQNFKFISMREVRLLFEK